MSQERSVGENDCVIEFKQGNKETAMQLLEQMPQSQPTAAVLTKFDSYDCQYLLPATRVSLVHLAAYRGWMDTVEVLIATHNCDPHCKDSLGRTPLFYAVCKGHLRVTWYFFSVLHCYPMSRDKDGWTPLHYACRNGCLAMTRYLVSNLQCDPSSVTTYDDTPLHCACMSGKASVVEYLLATGKVNPVAENKFGRTPVYYASESEKSYELLKLFPAIQQCRKDFPVHTYTKIVLIGYSGAGKTTISQLVSHLATTKASNIFSLLSQSHVTNVKCLTAGIIPHRIESKVKEVGNMVIYDFAGQQEYYSSHVAVLERIMRDSAVIFLCIVNMSQSKERIVEAIHYWMSFIESACGSTTKGPSHIITIGSHADAVKSFQELQEKSKLVESIAKSRVEQSMQMLKLKGMYFQMKKDREELLVFEGFLRMNCRQLKSKAGRHLLSLISTSQRTILSSEPTISFYCHVLYSFLRTKLGKTGCRLNELTSALESDDSFRLTSENIVELLTTLSNRGLIIFIMSQSKIHHSWIVVEKESLLREVNGTLFAPPNFKEYCPVASNTGVVPISAIHTLFPQHDPQMLVGFLESMEFCHPLSPLSLRGTNLKVSEEVSESASAPPSKVKYYFFPSLVKEHRPDNLPSPKFGWCLGCSDSHLFFSNRFFHVLLLRIAFTFPLASKHLPKSSFFCGLERRCQIWRNGISWKCVSGVSTIVEIVDNYRWIIVLLSKKSREAAEIWSNVIKMILDLQHELCGIMSVCECLISPSLLDQYPFDTLSDTDLFSMHDVANSMLLRHDYILDWKKGENEIPTEDFLSFEPYYQLQPFSVCQLVKNDDQPVPETLLREVLNYCKQPQQMPQDHKELRECLNKQSIFAGRNPLVSNVHYRSLSLCYMIVLFFIVFKSA